MNTLKRVLHALIDINEYYAHFIIFSIKRSGLMELSFHLQPYGRYGKGEKELAKLISEEWVYVLMQYVGKQAIREHLLIDGEIDFRKLLRMEQMAYNDLLETLHQRIDQRMTEVYDRTTVWQS